MVESNYDWANGAELKDHTRCKHKILREYFSEYLHIRCKLPNQERFKLAVIDGFAGGGRYKDNEPGSPIIFVEELVLASKELNIQRAADGMKQISIECLLFLNEPDDEGFYKLKENMAPVLASAKGEALQLSIQARYSQKKFEEVIPEIENMLVADRYRNVLFNLDQCGHSHVSFDTLNRIMRLQGSVEIFYTFVISSLLAFLKRSDPVGLRKQMAFFDFKPEDLGDLEGLKSKREWLGCAERLVFNAFKGCAPFHSPFSINNPSGWRYWLIHFSKMYRARQVYNNILHENASHQAHFGRPGLTMLDYDPSKEGTLYLFDTAGRLGGREQLYDDIPRLISGYGDAVRVEEFYESVYNQTPAHAEDIHESIMINPDIEVLTPKGGLRRSAKSIAVGDVLRLSKQPSFHFTHK